MRARCGLRKQLLTSALKSPKATLLDDAGNVVQFPERDDDTIGMGRPATGMELRCAQVLYETHTGESWDGVAVDSVLYWIWIKTAHAMIREMRTLSYDVVQKIRGKPFHDAKDIWETIIDECSP